MNERTRTYLFRTIAFLAAGGLLYLALRSVDLSEVGTALRQADYRWAIPAIAITLLAHLCRAWRWQILVNTLPGTSGEADGEPDRPPVGLWTPFGSIMIGYMVNYAAPRLGEIARTANLAREERLPFSSLFGTVVIERALDMTILAGALVSAVVLVADRLVILDRMFWEPVEALAARPEAGWTLAGGALILMTAFGAGGYWLWSRSRSGQLAQLWSEYGRPLLRSFVDGVRTLFRTGRPLSIIASTVGMWLGYLLMAYIPFLMLDMAGPYDLSLVDTWVIMILGSLGVVVPVPGGTGSYHYITIETLVRLFGVDPAPAATYAVLTHAGQLILYVVVGMGFFLWEGATWKRLRKKPDETPSDS